MKRTPLLVLGIAPAVGLALALSAIANADPATASQSRKVAAFHAIDLAGTIAVDATVGKAQSVEITGDADVLDKVITTVKDGVLIIDTARDLDRHQHRNTGLRAVVSVPSVTALTLSGTGAMKATGIASDQLSIDLSGTGALTATGTTSTLRVAVGGTGQISAADLAAKDVVVDIDGTGAAELHATHSLEARITGTGSVDVRGHPAQVKKSVSGPGSVRVR
jgi:hypothetical protein